MMKNLCVHKQDRQRERERHKENNIFQKATITNDNQPFLKVTKSLYIVTILGKLPFMLFTKIAQTLLRFDSILGSATTELSMYAQRQNRNKEETQDINVENPK